jgi:hypothetical protein
MIISGGGVALGWYYPLLSSTYHYNHNLNHLLGLGLDFILTIHIKDHHFYYYLLCFCCTAKWALLFGGIIFSTLLL